MESQKYWYKLIESLIDIINYLSQHNLAFRVYRQFLNQSDSENSGHFIHLLKVLFKYDLTLIEHI